MRLRKTVSIGAGEGADVVTQLVVGKWYQLTAPLSLSRWCICDEVLPVGQVIRIWSQPSPNMVEIGVPFGDGLRTNYGLHLVRRSTLRLITDEAELPIPSGGDVWFRGR